MPIGPLELVIILVIALLILGPGKLPDVGAALGKSIREFRKASSEFQESVRIDTSPLPPPDQRPAAQVPPVPPAPTSTEPPVAPAPAAPVAPPAPSAGTEASPPGSSPSSDPTSPRT
jgi:TatA/E family protein of Tat protein translocase